MWTLESFGLLLLWGSAASILYCLATMAYRIWLHPLSKVPGPPIYAATDFFNQWSSNVKGTFPRQVTDLHRQYGSIVRVGPNRVAVDGSIGYPEVYALRTKSKLEFPKVNNYISPKVSLTILGSSNEDHRRLRRQLGYAFSETALREQGGIISQYVDMLIEQLSLRSQTGEAVDIVKWLNYTMFDIISDLTFAESFNSLSSGNEHPYLQNHFAGVIGNGYQRFLTSYPYLKALFYLIIGPQELKDALKYSEENFHIGEQKRQTRMQLGPEPADGRRDFMTYMMRKTSDGSEGMSESEIRYNSPLLIAAGSETTASALSFFFFIAGSNVAQKKIVTEEIRSAFTDEAQIKVTSTGQLVYLQACIEETLRMFPPAAETPPRVSPGVEVDGQYLPAGTIIHVYPWATFRNPKNFVDPDSFRPERWLSPSHPCYDTRYANDNRACVKPFSHGPRDCIGKNLAYTEMRLTISRLLHRFDFELLPGQEKWHEIQNAYLIWNKSPLKVHFLQRRA